MQVRAIFEAAVALQKGKRPVAVQLEISGAPRKP